MVNVIMELTLSGLEGAFGRRLVCEGNASLTGDAQYCSLALWQEAYPAAVPLVLWTLPSCHSPGVSNCRVATSATSEMSSPNHALFG